MTDFSHLNGDNGQPNDNQSSLDCESLDICDYRDHDLDLTAIHEKKNQIKQTKTPRQIKTLENVQAESETVTKTIEKTKSQKTITEDVESTRFNGHKYINLSPNFTLKRRNGTRNIQHPGTDDLIKHEQAVVMQRTVHTHQLPPNLTKLQLKGLSARMRICERSALSGSVLYVCIACVLANQQTICRKGKTFPTRGQCKYDFDSQSLVCSVCQSHSIISISTLGRIISIRNFRFYLTPCCSTVRLYTGRGGEFLDTPETCPHKQEKKSSKVARKRCELCPNVALPEPHSSVDHLTGEQHCTYLCQRHTPHSDILKRVTNWRQLQEEIRRRDRPLFTMKYSGRGNKEKQREDD